MNTKTNEPIPPCSIVNIDGKIVVIDHRHDDRIIEPACGADALAHYNFLKNSLRHGGPIAARQFLVQIADSETPVTDSGERAKPAAIK